MISMPQKERETTVGDTVFAKNLRDGIPQLLWRVSYTWERYGDVMWINFGEEQ